MIDKRQQPRAVRDVVNMRPFRQKRTRAVAQAIFYLGPRGTRQGINYLFVNVEWRYGYDANAVLLKNFTKIDSCVLLYHKFEQNVPGNTENLDMTEPDSKGRWWTPRGENPWAWAFGAR